MRKQSDSWDSGESYELYMGRWSKLIALKFLNWLNPPINLSWLDIGCGTGALTKAIYDNSQPKSITGIDPSAEFLNKAKEKIFNKAEFIVGTSTNIPKEKETFDKVVSGLALNFFQDIDGSFSEIKRVLKKNGEISAYVWDYSDRMDFLRLFWDAVKMIDPDAQNLDEGIRFPICSIINLKKIFQEADLFDIETTYLDINTIFFNFEDFWKPFLGGQGPAPSYLHSLTAGLQNRIKTKISETITFESDGSIKLLARAIAIRGTYN
jgi:SAM-dependent methyltransferase